VLVFGVPHGPLSQPWSVLGGHAVSAMAGITVAHVVGRGMVPAALAVGLAIGAMHTLRCIHPPGGATALAAVVTVSKATNSWLYPLTPVLLNAATLVVAATILNAPFAWRRYPLAFAFPHPHRGEPPPPPPPFTAEQLAIALDEIDIVATMSDEDLQVVYRSIRRQQEADGRAGR
jgi:CBS-domain-containing membrane protein